MGRELIQGSFVYGEVSKGMQAAPLREQYFSSLALCRNCILIPGHGVSNRFGTQAIANLDDYATDDSKIATFVTEYGHTCICIFPRSGANKLEVFCYLDLNDGTAASGTVDYGTLMSNYNTSVGYDFFDTVTIGEAFEDLTSTQIGNRLCFGFLSVGFFTLRVTYDVTGSAPVFDAFTPDYTSFMSDDEYQAESGFKYADDTSGADEGVAVTEGGTPNRIGGMRVVYTLVDDANGAESFYFSTVIENATDFDATKYLIFAEDGLVIGSPWDRINVYISLYNAERDAKLLGSVYPGSNDDDKLIYIGQVADESRSYPLPKRLVTQTADAAMFEVSSQKYVNGPNRALGAAVIGERLALAGFVGNNKSDTYAIAPDPNKIAFTELKTIREMSQRAEQSLPSYPFDLDILAAGRINHVLNHRRLLLFTDRGVISMYFQEAAAAFENAVVNSPNEWVSDYNVSPVTGGSKVFFNVSRGRRIIRGTYVREFNGYEFGPITDMSKDLLEEEANISGLSYDSENYNTLWITYSKNVNQRQNVPASHVVGITNYEGSNLVGFHGHDFNADIIDIHTSPRTELGSYTYMITKRALGNTTAGNDFVYFLEKMPSDVELKKNITNDTSHRDKYLDLSFFSYATRHGNNVDSIGLMQAEIDFVTPGNPFRYFPFDVDGNSFSASAGDRIRFQNTYYRTDEMITWDVRVIEYVDTGTPSTSYYRVESDELIPEAMEVNIDPSFVAVYLRDEFTVPVTYAGLGLAMKADGQLLYHSDLDEYDDLYVEASDDIALGGWYDFIVIGVPYVSEIMTQKYKDTDRRDFIDKYKSVQTVDLELQNTKSIRVTGTSIENYQNIGHDDMDELPELDQNLQGLPFTGNANINMQGDLDKAGQVLIRQYYPEPMNVLSIAPEIDE